MGNCKNCKHFFNLQEHESGGKTYKYGDCKMIEVAGEESVLPLNSTIYSDEVTVGIDFCCIHFESNA